jgi:arylsulfatase A-like enzyme
MQRVLSGWLPRGLLAMLASAAALLAWREGGGADPRPRPPEPEALRATADVGGTGRGARAYQVRARLVEGLGEARLEVPNLAPSQHYLQTYWRRLKGPWVRLPGAAGQLALTVAMREAGESEAQWTVPTTDGRTWTPEARVWNMNEGRFDQREAIYAPTPATLAFPLNLPPAARFRAAPGVALPPAATTVFDVSLIDAAGSEHALAQTRIAGADARRWGDIDVDLGPWGGQKVQLVLRTSTDKAAADERPWTRSQSDERAPDGGVEPVIVPAMSLAFWGSPVVVASESTRVPYNVLWIVVDALRPDVAASLHDPQEDAAKLAAPRPPLEALLPAVPGLMPSVDRLAARGVHFSHAWSVGSWTRTGTLAMLAGSRSSELGIDPTPWVVPPEHIARFYASDPALVPLLLRRAGMATAAFVNNFFMAGYAAVGLDMGFERVTDYRYRTRDTAAIEQDALGWLDAHARDRFFAFVNFNSPHEPYDPPKELLERIPPAPAGPRDWQVRAYMAEAAKDDAAIGALLDKIDALGLTKSTLVIVTSDHGETLSSAHDAFGLDRMPMRFHHAVGNFEETARIPMLLALPGVLEGGRAIADRVRSVDIAPTVLDVEGLEADPRMSGRSLLPLARGQGEGAPRTVVTEGRASRALLWDHWRLVVHDTPPPDALSPDASPPDGSPRDSKARDAKARDAKAHAPRPRDAKTRDAPSRDAKTREGPTTEDELYDLNEDPGERHNVATLHRDVVAEMHARLAAALANTPTADVATTPVPPTALPTVHLRFVGAGRARRVSGSITAGDGKHGVVVRADPQGVPPEVLRVDGPRLDFAMTTAPDAPVGVDLRVDPPGAPIAWEFFLDDGPWPAGATFVGPFGLAAAVARTGIADDEARAEVYAAAPPLIDAARDLGVFVTRDKPLLQGAAGPAEPIDPGAAEEMKRVLQDWGYAHGSGNH